jgi:alcohol dehydrogenase class IV
MISGAHGAICAGLLPYVVETNIKALRTRAADSPALARYDELACILTQKANARAEDGIEWIKNLCQTLQIKSLEHLGLNKADFQAVAEKSKIASSMQGNPIRLTEAELLEVLDKAL